MGSLDVAEPVIVDPPTGPPVVSTPVQAVILTRIGGAVPESFEKV